MELPDKYKGTKRRVGLNFSRDVLNLCTAALKQSMARKAFFNTRLNRIVEHSMKVNTRLSRVDRVTKGYAPDGTPKKTMILIGGRMESMEEALKITNASIEEQKRKMQELYNELSEMDQHISPMLTMQIQKVRDARMTVEREIGIMMTQLRDVRKFFVEDDYKKEVQRINEFVELIGNLKKLKEDGTLDALAETIVKMQGGGNDKG